MNIVYWSHDLVFSETELLECVKFGCVVMKMQPRNRPRTSKFGWRPVETYTLVYGQPVASHNLKSGMAFTLESRDPTKMLSDLLPDGKTHRWEQCFENFNMQLFLDATRLSQLQDIID